MPKLAELLERRATALDTMKANEEQGGAAFDSAKSEYDTVTLQIERARVVENAERQERGRPLSGDGHLETEIRSKFSLSRAVAGAARCNPNLQSVPANHRKAFSSRLKFSKSAC
jgi:hypothetical protein